MCGFCAAAQLKSQCDDNGFGSLQADVATDGFGSETIVLGESLSGSLSTGSESDLYQLDIAAGETVQINLGGTGENGVEDTIVRIYDADGNLVAQNDDTNGLSDKDSTVTFTAETDGPFFVEVGSFDGRYAGDYELSANLTQAASFAGTPLEGIAGNTKLDDSDPVKVYFAQAGEMYPGAVFGQTTASGTSAYEQAQWQTIFDNVESFTNLEFTITTNKADADLEIVTGDLKFLPGFILYGVAEFPTNAGEGGWVQINNTIPGFSDSAGGSMDSGGYMLGVAFHEFGHALGMGHPHDTGNGSAVMSGVSNDGDPGDFDLNQAVNTAMSYVDGSLIAGVTSDSAATGNRATYGAFDIAVLQDAYGVNTTHAAGNDTYALWDTNAAGSGASYSTIWDTDGIDGIEYVGAKDATIDLRAATLQYEDLGGGGLSYVDGVIGGWTIANGVVVENGTTGSGNDLLIGNDADNTLDSGLGNDTLAGLNGDDTLKGREGQDLIIAGKGTDDVTGNDGADKLRGNGGNDTLRGQKGDDTVNGGAGNDNITGGDDNDRMIGGSGNDTMDGGAGDDIYAGGNGSDIFVFSDGLDVAADFDVVDTNEKIDLSGNGQITSYFDLVFSHLSQSGANAVIDDGAGNTLTLLNVNTGDLTADSFIF